MYLVKGRERKKARTQWLRNTCVNCVKRNLLKKKSGYSVMNAMNGFTDISDDAWKELQSEDSGPWACSFCSN